MRDSASGTPVWKRAKARETVCQPVRLSIQAAASGSIQSQYGPANGSKCYANCVVARLPAVAASAGAPFFSVILAFPVVLLQMGSLLPAESCNSGAGRIAMSPGSTAVAADAIGHAAKIARMQDPAWDRRCNDSHVRSRSAPPTEAKLRSLLRVSIVCVHAAYGVLRRRRLSAKSRQQASKHGSCGQTAYGCLPPSLSLYAHRVKIPPVDIKSTPSPSLPILHGSTAL
ncbi:hypothetical protein TARUN_6016 [Trichoderma arundinaceum]|uniref:Uncharacterized protein n=1 Tax=Trichoderma arundinaceum TaxID=490622 RepID=A0A395NJM7_TRIAR|nr:hypothetical protein TARUN_6016 [Trichoderma arundinaceum]